jgi:biopolymer transport protein ExbD
MGSFRRRSALHTYEAHFGPNMTPMVDVVMVILIFFMASTSFVGSEWFLRAAIPREAPAAPPEVQTSAGDPFRLPPARFEIDLVRQDGRTIVASRGMSPGTLGELPGMLRELAGVPEGGRAPEMVLIVRAGADVPYADVIRAHEAAAAAGIEKVGMMDLP